MSTLANTTTNGKTNPEAATPAAPDSLTRADRIRQAVDRLLSGIHNPTARDLVQRFIEPGSDLPIDETAYRFSIACHVFNGLPKLALDAAWAYRHLVNARIDLMTDDPGLLCGLTCDVIGGPGLLSEDAVEINAKALAALLENLSDEASEEYRELFLRYCLQIMRQAWLFHDFNIFDELEEEFLPTEAEEFEITVDERDLLRAIRARDYPAAVRLFTLTTDAQAFQSADLTRPRVAVGANHSAASIQ